MLRVKGTETATYAGQLLVYFRFTAAGTVVENVIAADIIRLHRMQEIVLQTTAIDNPGVCHAGGLCKSD